MSTDATKVELPSSVKRYALYLMVMAGLGGLLYGIDVGVIAAALPYIEKTSSYTPQQLAIVVAAVLFGSVLSSLFAGMLAEWLGRKKVIILSALLAPTPGRQCGVMERTQALKSKASNSRLCFSTWYLSTLDKSAQDLSEPQFFSFIKWVYYTTLGCHFKA